MVFFIYAILKNGKDKEWDINGYIEKNALKVNKNFLKWSAKNKKSNGMGQKFKYDFSKDGKIDVSFARLNLTRKEIDNITDWVKRPQIGATGLLWIKHNTDSSIKSSFDKFFSESDLKYILDKVSSKPGDIIFIMSGDKKNTLEQMGSLRVELAKRFDLVDHNKMCPLWVTDFPLFEWDEDEKRFFSMHHPFTSPKQEFLDLLESDPI